MKDTKKVLACFSCDRPETSVPLLVVRYASRELHICPHCLPVLIHHPEELSEKLSER